MKGMSGRFLKKLKFVPTLSTLKKGLVLHQFNPTQNFHIQSVCKEQQEVVGCKDHKDDEMEMEFDIIGYQQNFAPAVEYSSKADIDDTVHEEDNSQVPISSEYPTLSDFEERCPPGGEESVVFYTTSLRGIRKTFEGCSSIRFLLESFKVLVYERDVSMDMEFREELWRILGGRVIPPRLFIKGRYIGGADEVVGLHEQGKLKKLLEGIPSGMANRHCNGCANMRFLVCSNCNGSRKVYADGGESEGLCIRCPECNENGLVKCPNCLLLNVV